MAKNKFFHAVKWAIISNCGREGITLFITFTLAAILGPTDFGTVAIALVYITFVQMFVDFGFNEALIQRKNLTPLHLDSIFWLILGASILLMGVSIGLSDWWAGINHLPKLTLVICALAITIPVQGLILVQQALFHRKMDFKSLAIRDNISVFVGGCVGISMAITGYGVWALVCQQLCRTIVALLLIWRLSHWRPRLRFSIRHVKDLIRFSTTVFIGTLGVYIQGQADVLLMGIFFGPTAVGLYRLADRLMNMLLKLITRAIQIVSLPFFSGIQDDRDKLKQGLLSCWRISSIMTIPPMIALATLSDLIMPAIGPQWTAAANVLKILCIIGLTKSLTLFTGTLLKAISKPAIHTGMVWGLAIANTGAYIFIVIFLQDSSVEHQIIGIAGSRAFLFVLMYLPLNMMLTIRFASVTLRDLMATLGPSLLAGTIIVLVVNGLELIFGSMDFTPMFALIIIGAFTFIIGVGAIILLHEELRVYAYNFYTKKLNRFTHNI